MKIEPYEAIVRFDLVDVGKNDLRSVVKEVTPLIRCKDCKHYIAKDKYCEAWADKFFDWEDWEYLPEDGYCSYAERNMCDDEKEDKL